MILKLFYSTTTTTSCSASISNICIRNRSFPIEKAHFNISPSLIPKIDLRLYKQPNHPIALIYQKIKDILQPQNFTFFEDFHPVVSVKENFDNLLFPSNHPGRSKSDSFFLSKSSLLRTHTTVHDVEALQFGGNKIAIIGEVFRRDHIDKFHFPIFHQLDLIKIFDNENSLLSDEEIVQELHQDIVSILSSCFLSKENFNFRWNSSFFPFTQPSFELEIEHSGKWIEILGGGILRKEILQIAGIAPEKKAYAAGIGLERIAMLLFAIPDIRLFWSQNPKFLSQWQDGIMRPFVAFSKYPACERDISFWIPSDDDNYEFDFNSFHEIIREEGADLVQQVTLIDEFECGKTNRKSKTFRITFQSFERNLQNTSINQIQERIRASTEALLGVKLR